MLATVGVGRLEEEEEAAGLTLERDEGKRRIDVVEAEVEAEDDAEEVEDRMEEEEVEDS